MRRNDRLVGFCLGRPGSSFHQVGPVMAASQEDAGRLVRAALSALAGRPVLLDVPEARAGLRRELRRLGFEEQRPFIRMARGVSISNRAPRQLFASAGPELG